MMQVDVTKCTGCGQCLDVCPVGAISLVIDRAVIDPETCILCGACSYTCPQAAISEALSPETAITTPNQPAKIQSVSIETRIPVSPAQPGGRLAWAMPVIPFAGKEIRLRLADSFLNALDRRLSTSAKGVSPLDVRTALPERGLVRQARRRRSGSNGCRRAIITRGNCRP